MALRVERASYNWWGRWTGFCGVRGAVLSVDGLFLMVLRYLGGGECVVYSAFSYAFVCATSSWQPIWSRGRSSEAAALLITVELIVTMTCHILAGDKLVKLQGSK